MTGSRTGGSGSAAVLALATAVRSGLEFPSTRSSRSSGTAVLARAGRTHTKDTRTAKWTTAVRSSWVLAADASSYPTLMPRTVKALARRPPANSGSGSAAAADGGEESVTAWTSGGLFLRLAWAEEKAALRCRREEHSGHRQSRETANSARGSLHQRASRSDARSWAASAPSVPGSWSRRYTKSCLVAASCLAGCKARFHRPASFASCHCLHWKRAG